MNKKLIALAVAGVLAAPLVAQAQTANVTMYGALRTALVSTKTQNGARVTGVDAHSSRWGVRGTEQINSGLNAIFEFETGLASDQVGNVPYNIRTSWVGLSGAGFGTIKGGAGLTPWDDVMGMTHHSLVAGFNNQNAHYVGGIGAGPFQNYQSSTVLGYSGVGQSSANNVAVPAALTATACNSTAFDARYANSISYETPNLGGFTVRSQYAFLNENTGRADKANCSGWDTGAKFAMGPVGVGVAYAKHNNFYGPVTHDANNILVRVTGLFGPVGFGAGFDQGKYTGDQHSSGTAKYRTLFVGLYGMAGATRIGVDYAKRDNGLTVKPVNYAVPAATLGVSGILETNPYGGGQHTTFYVNHPLSKRTVGYFWASQNKPEAGSATAAPAAKVTQLAVALAHAF